MISAKVLRRASGILDILSLFFTIFLLGFGFVKGYNIIELTTYNIYFMIVIINSVINLKIKS